MSEHVSSRCRCMYVSRPQAVWRRLQRTGVRLPRSAASLQCQGQHAKSCGLFVHSARMERVAWPHSRAVRRTAAVCDGRSQLWWSCTTVPVYTWPHGHGQQSIMMMSLSMTVTLVCELVLWWLMVCFCLSPLNHVLLPTYTVLYYICFKSYRKASRHIS